MDAERYHSPYTEDSPYGLAVSLLSRHARRDASGGGLVVDLGCGYGATAEALRRLGLTYVGIDSEPAGLEDLASRGFETAVVDLADAGQLAERLESVLEDRPLAAFSALDIVEHLMNGDELLSLLRAVAVESGGAPLVVSIPNVTHLDLAAKLLLGRWDVTPVGLLDVTHVSLYSPERLERTFAAAGWRQVDATDFLLPESDQHFPAEAATLAETPLRRLLARLRTRAAPGALTNQFIRAYSPEPVSVPVPSPSPGPTPALSPVPVDAAAPARPPVEHGPAVGPFLSVLLLAGGGGGGGGAEGGRVATATGDDPAEGDLADVLSSLDAQRSKDFELVVIARTTEELAEQGASLGKLLGELSPELSARTRLVEAPAGGRGAALEAGVQAARGRYVTVLDARSVCFAHYVESFARLATERPGAVLRCLAVAQAMRPATVPASPRTHEAAGPPVAASTARFCLDEHVFQPLSPPGSYALARSCFTDLGLSFAEAVPGAEEEDVLIEAAMLCGVHESPGEITLVRRRYPGDGIDGAGNEARQLLAEKLDAGPLVLPAGSIARFWQQREALRLANETTAEGGDAAAAASAGIAEEHRRELAAVHAELRATEARLVAARAELDELRRSTSWRVTEPLRRLTDRLRPPD